MKLTPENKQHIDSLSLFTLLERWRNVPIGDEWFEGETGCYWGKRMNELKSNSHVEYAEYVAASKAIGWKQ
jgi:hypothetical protein